MRKIFVLIFILTTSIHYIFGQDPCGFQNNWDWLDESGPNWYGHVSYTSQTVSMGTPWGQGIANDDLWSIYLGKDYEKSGGWELIFKDFGCEDRKVGYPYFILYNKYTGILRYFIFTNEDDNYKGAVTNLEWRLSEGMHTSLLTHLNNYSLINEQYNPNINTTIKDKGTYYVEDYYTNGHWYVTEFQTNFDHRKISDKKLTDLRMKVFTILESEVKLKGDFQFETKSGLIKEATNEEVSDDNYADKIYNWSTDTKKMLKKVPSDTDMEGYFKNIVKGAEKLDTLIGNDFTQKVEDFAVNLEKSGFKKFLKGTCSIAEALPGGLGIVAGVLSFFTGKELDKGAQGSTFHPTVSTGTIELTGTIKTETKATSEYLQVPGSDYFGTNSVPYFDCPLGVVGLIDQPNFSIREWTETEEKITNSDYVLISNGQRYTTEWTSGSTNVVSKECEYGPLYVLRRPDPVQEDWKSIKIDGNLNIAINAASDVKVVDARIAFMASVQTKDENSLKYDVFEKKAIPPNPYPVWSTNSSNEYTIYYCSTSAAHLAKDVKNSYKENLSNYWENKTYQYMEEGFYELTAYKEDTTVEFITPLVSLEEYKGMSITVRKETDLYLKVLVTVKPLDTEQSHLNIPILATYKLDESKFTKDSKDEPYEFILAQFNGLNKVEGANCSVINTPELAQQQQVINTYIEASQPVSVLSQYRAELKINFKPGFKVVGKDVTYFNAACSNWNDYPSTASQLSESVTYYYQGQVSDEPIDCECENELFTDPMRLKAAVLESETIIKPEFENETVNDVQEKLLKVYPNPNNGLFKVDFNLQEKVTYSVLNIIGSTILTGDLNIGETSIDLTNEPNGIYILLVRANDGSIHRERIVKQ